MAYSNCYLSSDNMTGATSGTGIACSPGPFVSIQDVSVICVGLSSVFYEMFCRWLFVFFSFFFLLLHSLSFFDLPLLIVPMVTWSICRINDLIFYYIVFKVHTLTTLCEYGRTCNCGIAIRSHDSLFVVRTCNVISTAFYTSGRRYPSMTYSMCDNKHMVIEKISDIQYKVRIFVRVTI